VCQALLEQADVLAPADITDLLGEEELLRSRTAGLQGMPGKIMRAQLDLVLACLHDHAAGACPQIPYRCISLLGAAVAYLANELDFVPDFLPQGALDDALVLALACELAADALERYCTWKGIKPGLGLPATAAARASRVRMSRSSTPR
jgi:uncharacterized membrane protein YkvA (DUF1232 family)